MKFYYVYKTSDGQRHEDEIEAENRDAVFTALRGRDIRPIKVVAANGSKANGETRFITRKSFIFGALAIGLLVGVSAVIISSRVDFRDKRLIDFESRANAIIKQHETMVSTLHLEALRNYREIFASKGTWMTDRKIELSQFSFKETRQTLKDLFREAYEIFPAETKERAEVERIYQRMMDAVDLGEARILNDEKAFRLLNANRGKWRVENGRIEWSDASLAADFAGFTRDLQ